MLTNRETSYTNETQVNLACFEVMKRQYALDVSQVKEIVRFQEITPLPMAPELIEGVVDLRGVVVPVIDLARLLHGSRTEISSQARIVILDFDGMVLGLCVEAATDVLSLHPSAMGDIPDLASQAGYEAVRHVVRRPNAAPVMVLSLEHILENVYRSALGRQGDAEQ